MVSAARPIWREISKILAEHQKNNALETVSRVRVHRQIT